jgi:glycosyltransferase involved in cell wall biosynthesis
MKSCNAPKISFGIIVLNGEPFIEYCVRGLYSAAHEIIIAEGAAKSASEFSTKDGHSLDDTRAILRQVKADHDPDNKIILVENDGFWANRDEQSQAYAERATGDYLWQVDMDEFYTEHALEAMKERLRQDPTITGASFRWKNFFGCERSIVDGWFLMSGGGDVNRLMKWGQGFAYGKHWEGSRSFDPNGRDMTTVNWLSADDTAAIGVELFHYSLVFPFQVISKSRVYQGGMDPTFEHKEAELWATEVWRDLKRPFDVHNRYGKPAWLEAYDGPHPASAEQMFRELASKYPSLELRRTDDIWKLLKSRHYLLNRAFARRLFYFRNRLGDTHYGYWVERLVFNYLNFGVGAVLKKSFARLGIALRRRLGRKPRATR